MNKIGLRCIYFISTAHNYKEPIEMSNTFEMTFV